MKRDRGGVGRAGAELGCVALYQAAHGRPRPLPAAWRADAALLQDSGDTAVAALGGPFLPSRERYRANLAGVVVGGAAAGGAALRAVHLRAAPVSAQLGAARLGCGERCLRPRGNHLA